MQIKPDPSDMESSSASPEIKQPLIPEPLRLQAQDRLKDPDAYAKFLELINYLERSTRTASKNSEREIPINNVVDAIITLLIKIYMFPATVVLSIRSKIEEIFSADIGAARKIAI